MRCSRNETFDLYVTLQQLQKPGRDTVDVHAVSSTPVFCTTIVRPWSVAHVPPDEPFQTGDAVATVATMNTAKWVTPTSVNQSVKLFRGRR